LIWTDSIASSDLNWFNHFIWSELTQSLRLIWTDSIVSSDLCDLTFEWQKTFNKVRVFENVSVNYSINSFTS
jgi:hypothetical protein